MELTDSFVVVLQHFAPVFTSPTYVTFLAIVTGWVLSHRRRYVTDVIFSSGNVGNGHWCRFHRFFSHAAWDLDTLSLYLVRLIVAIFAPGAMLSWAVDDTLCRKRGLTLYGAGMHYDPLISSRSKRLVSWGHDWVVLCLIVARPFWAPTKVFALPVAVRLYRNRQGLVKGKKGRGKTTPTKRDPDHRTRPELALELIQLVARWFPGEEIMITGDSAYGGKSILSYLPPNVHLISHVHPDGVLYEPAPPKPEGTKGRRRTKGNRLPKMKQWAEDASRPWTKLKFNQFGLHATLAVKTIRALYYTAGADRLLTIVLVRDLEGKRPDQMFYCTKLDWTARQILSTYACRWAIECTFENCKQLLGFEDAANRVPKAVQRTAPMALVVYSLVIAWFHQTGHQSVRLPYRPWYRTKQEPSFADMLTTLRRLSYQEQTERPPSKRCSLKTVIAQLTEFLSHTG
jgi:SRSO17 transposase